MYPSRVSGNSNTTSQSHILASVGSAIISCHTTHHVGPLTVQMWASTMFLHTTFMRFRTGNHIRAKKHLSTCCRWDCHTSCFPKGPTIPSWRCRYQDPRQQNTHTQVSYTSQSLCLRKHLRNVSTECISKHHCHPCCLLGMYSPLGPASKMENIIALENHKHARKF